MHEPTPIILRRIQSPQHWLRFWLEKLDREMQKQGLSVELRRAHAAVIREFLTLNPGNPRAIAPDKVRQFVVSHKGEAIEALQFFYQHVSYSQENQACLTECASARKALPLSQAAEAAQSPAEVKPAVPSAAKPVARKKAAPKSATRKAAATPKAGVKAAGTKSRKKS
jgi:hypothetical protein